MTPDINVNPLSPVVIDGSIMELNITGPDDINGMIVVSGDLNYVIDNFNGSYNLSFSDLEPGFYNINITYIENNKYTKETVSTNITVEPKDDVPMEISDIQIEYGETAKVVVTGLDNIIGQEIMIKVNNFIKPVTVDNTGKASAKFDDLETGKYQILAYYYGDDLHYATEANATLTVLPTNTTIDISVDETYYVDDDVVITLTPSIDLPIKVTINGKEYEVSENNTVTLTVVNGTYIVVATLEGDKNHIGSQSNATFYVNKITPEITVDVPFSYAYDGQLIIVELPSDATGLVTAEINGTLYASLVDNETAVINVPNLSSGNYTTIVTYHGDDKYESVNTSENFNIEDHLEVFAPDVVKYYKGSERFEVEVIFNNQPREGQTVRITINGVEYKKTTDKNGIASLALNLDEGNYSVLVRVDDLEFNSSVTILPTVFGKDISKIFKNGTQYYATFTDSEGNLLVNKEVTFNINGVFYNRTTDNNGVAKLNINLQPGKYIITAYNPITGDTYANNIYVLSHFVEHDDLEKIYGSSTPFVIRLCDDQGNIETSGKTVTFNINGVFYNRTSDSNGYVKLNINLMAGEYIITSIYGDEAINDKITVRPQLN